MNVLFVCKDICGHHPRYKDRSMKRTSKPRGITDKIAREWADRNGLEGVPIDTLRCAIDDARSIPELAAAP